MEVIIKDAMEAVIFVYGGVWHIDIKFQVRCENDW